MTLAANPLEAFAWTPQPQAENLVRDLLDRFVSACPAAASLGQRMREQTGTRLIDWIDYIKLPGTDPLRRQIESAGFTPHPRWNAPGATCYAHPGGMFPLLSFTDDAGGAEIELAIKVESVADFAAINRLAFNCGEPPLSRARGLVISESPQAIFAAVERHGYRGLNPPDITDRQRILILAHIEQFRARPRGFDDDLQGFAATEALIDAAIADLGQDLACDVFFAAERDFWMRRNRAAQVQYARQQRLGLGWANHDHHTYRSSRHCFSQLVHLWEKLGFICRERFYAGREAGWGAQVMEQPNVGLITFNDVDLSPDELLNDFAHEPMAERESLGTVGLWCALHGESLLQAGMHHLEAQFDFDSLRQQLETEAGIRTMKPFTDFPYLRQAFTEGERWAVNPTRINNLLSAGKITPDQARQFREAGAIGSHLENLERNQGFKGFNQKGVSEIISATDPRRQP